jgi:hypothetical protein
MAETPPETGVEQERSPFQRVEALLGQSPDPAPEQAPEEAAPQEAKQPEGPATDELTPADLEDESDAVAQPAVDAFEIVHNGAQVKLTREEAIAYARQGFDYTQKTQALAEKAKQLESQLRIVSEVEQAQPYLMQERAQVAAIEQQLARYQNFNWVQLATEDPMGYPAQRAQYDVLLQAHQQATGQYKNKEAAVKQHLAQVVQQRMQVESARIPELIPEWKDPEKRNAGVQALAKHYESAYGIGFDELNSHMQGAISMAVAYKAMKYDQLVKAKGEKVKQLRTAPPVTIPGAKSGSAKADKDVELRGHLRKSGDARDAMAVLLNRMK